MIPANVIVFSIAVRYEGGLRVGLFEIRYEPEMVRGYRVETRFSHRELIYN